MMHQENFFNYTYNASSKQEALQIRNKYLPKEESKLDELKRLDRLVQSSGMIAALCVGIISCLIFGVGLCFCLEVIGSVTWPGILFGIVGTAGMLVAYPLQRKLQKKAKQKYVPRILELSKELSGEL